ncbi:unnamed protein product [Schistosoma rodhaini]|uniref:Uncharacterized protein n=1 Tax=Schistosoma rodhaini TaxID=6188 RepID=A0AA85GBL7_9TREM|nr:unnamed protein product [Schistosoma rodhaini]CAH8633092.1 unnamed protein product [Schistosoma rodhaini]
MMILAFTDVSKKTSENQSHCISTQFGSPRVLSGLILTLIGVVFGLMIMFIRKLYPTTIVNIIFVAITMIILFVGVALLLFPAQSFEILISELLAGMFCVLAIFLGLNLQLSKRKWKIIMFTMYCVFLVAAFILCVLGLTLHKPVLGGSALICCCCLMFIVSLFTAYYLNVHNKQEGCSLSYLLFVWIYECIAFVIIIQIVLNSFIDCRSNESNSNMTMIAQD